MNNSDAILCFEDMRTYPNPRLLQTTPASTLSNKSSQTVPHVPL